jgi:hypothetical protein
MNDEISNEEWLAMRKEEAFKIYPSTAEVGPLWYLPGTAKRMLATRRGSGSAIFPRKLVMRTAVVLLLVCCP